MRFGYFRTIEGDSDAAAPQRHALQEAGCERIIEDLVSDEQSEQPELNGLLEWVAAGNVVVVPRFECLGSSLPDGVRRMERIGAAGADFISLAEAIDTTTSGGRAAAQLIAGLAGSERTAARDRINAGLAAARAEGRVGGRRPKLTPPQRAAVINEVLSGRRSAADMARLYKVSEATVSRVLAAFRLAMKAPGTGRPDVACIRPSDRVAGVLPRSALDERLAIVGTSGSGKTYAAKGLVELLVELAARVCIVDPLGVWWGLRAGSDGSAESGYPVVVFGGRHADIALDEGMGTSLGHLVGTHSLACVVDVSELGSSAGRRAFMTAFAEAVYEANTEPLHLVLDEADLWAPQRAQHSGQVLLGRIEEIVRRGRVRGFVPWLITQRPAVLHKDVLSQADILVSMKLTSSQDREAVGRWIEGQADRAEGKRILAALPQLAQGEGYVWAPSDSVLARVSFPRIQSFDSSRTPQRRERVVTPRSLAVVDLRAITAALAKMEACTANRRDDTAPGGRKQVLDLERQLRQQDRELAAARARIAEIEAEAVAIQARLNQTEGRDDRAMPAKPGGGT